MRAVGAGAGAGAGAASSIAYSGDSLVVPWVMKATSALTGTNTIWTRARDRAGLDTGYQFQSPASSVIS